MKPGLRPIQIALGAYFINGAYFITLLQVGALAQTANVNRSLFVRLFVELECKPGQKCAPSMSRGLPGGPASARPAPDTDEGREKLQRQARLREYPTSDIEIYYDFNSIQLTEKTIETLNTIAAVMKTERYATSSFAMIGHTDAKGTDAFNMVLSERRAEAARQYLETTHGIGKDRLPAWGMGKRDLKVPSEPFSAANRRVQLINIGAMSPVASGPVPSAPVPATPVSAGPAISTPSVPTSQPDRTPASVAKPQPSMGSPPATPATEERLTTAVPTAEPEQVGCRYYPGPNITIGCDK